MSRVNLQQVMQQPYELQDMVQLGIDAVRLTAAVVFMLIPDIRFSYFMIMIFVQLGASAIKAGLYFGEQNKSEFEIGMYFLELLGFLLISWLPAMEVGIGKAVVPLYMGGSAILSLLYTLVGARILEQP